MAQLAVKLFLGPDQQDMRPLAFLLLAALLPLPAQAEYFRGVDALNKNDIAGATRELAPFAEAGEADAQNALGVAYDRSHAASDQARAAALFRQAAENGLLLGMLNLAKSLQAGRGVPPNPAEAAVWLTHAAQEGLEPAMVRLGDAYRTGLGVPIDKANARAWYEKAAKIGYAAGMAGVADLLLESGRPGAAEARTWLERASGAGNPHAQQELALAKMLGVGGVEKDVPGAIDLASRAAHHGDGLAAVILGDCYHGGVGVTASEAESLHWYAEAARFGAVRGQVETARAKLAAGPARDPSAAYFWTQVAAIRPGAMQATVTSLAEAAAREITPVQQAAIRQRAANWQPGSGY